MNEMLSQEEIDALLRNGPVVNNDSGQLTPEEIDALGEIGNISMGTSATTLFTLLRNKVTITTPRVEVTSPEKICEEYPLPFIAVQIKFKEGLEGANLLLLKDSDARIIADLMMGGDGSNIEGEVGEIHLSAISEAMNQMVGSASTSLSAMLDKPINITPPKVFKVDLRSQPLTVDFFKDNDSVVKVAFKMVVGKLIDSEIMQLLPVKFAKSLVAGLLKKNIDGFSAGEPLDTPKNDEVASLGEKQGVTADKGYQGVPEPEQKEGNVIKEKEVRVQPITLNSFEKDAEQQVEAIANLDLIKDVPLQVTVELGRTKKQIKEILQFGVGTIVELDKLAGEPVDILVNGKFIAKGEVVVIDESFGVRITDIIHPSKRINSLKDK